MITSRFTQKNPKFYEKYRIRLKQAGDDEAAVGFPSGKDGIASPHYDNGASILEVAIWNNFGTATIPRRPFMDNATPKIQENYKQMLRDSLARVNKGEITVKVVIKAAALKSEALIRNEIVSGEYKENSPETIAAKKSSKPLIWSGDMNKAVTSVVRKKS